MCAVLVFVLSLTFFLSGIRFRVVLCYSDDSYEEQATLYYAAENREFSEEHSIYTYAMDGKVVFDYNTGYDRMFVIPNREKGKTVHVSAVKLTINSVPVYMVSGDKLNDLVYSNKDENTAVFENGMLTLTATEENPYPRLIFADGLNDKAKKLEQWSTAYCVTASLICTAAVCLLFMLIKRFVSKRPKLKEFLKKYHAHIAFHTIGLVLLLAAMRYFNGYSVVVDYETDLSGNDSIIYFDYDNDGFKEINSTYTKINSLSGDNPFFAVSNIEGLRFVPNRAINTRARIKAVRLFHEGLPVKTYPAEDLKKKYLLNREQIVMDGDCIIVETGSKQQSYPIVSFNKRFLDELNGSSPTVLAADLIKVFAFFGLLLLCDQLYLKGKKDKLKYAGRIKGGTWTLAAVSFAAVLVCALLGIKVLAYIVMPLLLFIGVYAMGAYDKLKIGKKIFFAPVGAVLSTVMLFNINSGLFAKQGHFAYAFWCCILLALAVFCYIYTMQRLSGNYDKDARPHIENIAGFLVKITIAVFVYEYVKIGLQLGYYSVPYITEMLLGNVLQLNIMLLFALLCTIYGLLGKQWTNVLGLVVYGVLLSGNAIKLTYHNTMLTPADFLQFGDALSIAPTIFGETLWHIMLAGVVIVVIVLLLNIKRILPAIRPRPFWYSFFASGILLLVFGRGVVKGEYTDINVCDKPYIDEITAERTNGIAVYNMFKIMHIPDMLIKSPAGYNEQTVMALSEEFEKQGKKSDGVRPNVICILAESFIDLNSIEGLELDGDTIPYTRDHGFVTMISPRYGGYTAAVEYEVLTGMSLAFYPPSVIPYTAYYNDESRVIPSVPQTFKDNGYKTYAIHPNTANFYGRDKAYKMMGFEEYWAIEKFQGAEQVKNHFVRDVEVGNKIIQTIEDNDDPVFTFGITMESHATSEKRFDTPLFGADGEMTEREREDVVQEAMAYHDTDEMIKQLCEYIDSCDEPTMLYVFGDHLPPLSVFGNLSYVSDINNKYSTVALCHCNYKDIELKDRATPNYIAAQMIMDSGVPHSSYFNFIYGMKDRMPLLHRDFSEINIEKNEDLKKYYMIQYDIMFGHRWFYKKQQ